MLHIDALLYPVDLCSISNKQLSAYFSDTKKCMLHSKGINYGNKLHGKDWKLCFSSRTNNLLLTLSKQNSPSHTLSVKLYSEMSQCSLILYATFTHKFLV